MHLSRIRIENFRNFRDLEVALGGNIVIVGENRVGKSNLLFGLRLIFDPSLPDSSRQLGLADFWDGLEEITAETTITISVEIKDFEEDLDVLAVLTDYRLDDDPDTVRLTYQLRAQPGLDHAPASDDDFSFVCFGGEDEAKRFGHDLRRRITMDLLPALRDAEGDLAAWRRSPLRPLVEDAFIGIDKDTLKEIGEKIAEASAAAIDFEEVKTLEATIAELFLAMAGSKQDVHPTLGFSATEVYKHLFETIVDGKDGVDGDDDGDAAGPLSVILTTHSPHIASVAPLVSLLLLRSHSNEGTKGYSTAEADFTKTDTEDLERYLDVTRAEMVFARGVILVEGDAERFLIPAFAEDMDISLDEHGVSVCSVAGTNFQPYVKLLCALGIPFSVITDYDEVDEKPRAYNRALKLVRVIDEAAGGDTDAVIKVIKDKKTWGETFAEIQKFGIFVNWSTLETELFEGDYAQEMIDTLREHNFSAARKAILDAWEAKPKDFDADELLKMIEQMGKGRFAQRLATRAPGKLVPEYIADAINHVIGLV